MLCIHIVVLDLAKIPIIGVYKAAEGLVIAVVGKPNLSNLAAFTLLLKPLADTQVLQPLPGSRIGEHMHQIVVNIVCLQTAELLPEQLFHPLYTFDEVMGQLGCYVDLFPDTVFGKDLTNGHLTAGVNVGGIIIIYTIPVSLHDLLLCQLHIYLTLLALKAHTAKTKHRKVISLFILTVLHLIPSDNKKWAAFAAQHIYCIKGI